MVKISPSSCTSVLTINFIGFERLHFVQSLWGLAAKSFPGVGPEVQFFEQDVFQALEVSNQFKQ